MWDHYDQLIESVDQSLVKGLHFRYAGTTRFRACILGLLIRFGTVSFQMLRVLLVMQRVLLVLFQDKKWWNFCLENLWACLLVMLGVLLVMLGVLLAMLRVLLVQQLVLLGAFSRQKLVEKTCGHACWQCWGCGWRC